MARANSTHSDGLPAMNESLLYAGGDFAPEPDPLDSASPQDRGDEVTPEHEENGAKDRDPDTKETKKAPAKRKAKKPEPEPEDDPEEETEDDPEEETEDDPEEETEGETEDDPEEESEDDPEDEPKSKTKEKPGKVPKYRLDQTTKKLREQEKQNEALRKQLEKLQKGEDADTTTTENQENTTKAQQQANDEFVKDLETKQDEAYDNYEEAVIDGDTEKAKKFRKEIRKLENQLIDARLKAQSEQTTQTATKQAKVQAELNEAAQKVSSRYDAFNDKSESYDENATREVIRMRDYLHREEGMGYAEALAEAADVIAARYEFESNDADDAEPAKAEKKTTKRADADKAAKKRAAKAQPSKMSGQKNAKKEPRIADLSEKEFDDMMKNDPQKLAELRGDFRV